MPRSKPVILTLISFFPARLFRLVLAIACGIPFHVSGLTLPEIPPVALNAQPAGGSAFSWLAFRDQLYRVERSTSLANGSWSQVGDLLAGDGRWQTFVDPDPATKAFYRVAVVDEAFSPSALAPTWQLDATMDFQNLADGTQISDWSGTGLASYSQTNASSRPVYRDGSVVFDGAGDYLGFPMWPNGVGSEWTLAMLVKVRPGILNYSKLCGGSFGAERALELQWFNGDLSTRLNSNYDFGLIRTLYNCFPSDNWRVLTIRSTRGLTQTRLDGFETALGISLKMVGQSGTFNLASGYDEGANSSPISVRYAAFFPTSISDEECGKLERWMERKKQGGYPETQLFLAGGQSNYAASYSQMKSILGASFSNPVIATSSHYSATSLMAWMRDRSGGGYEVAPRVDLSEATPGSRAEGKQYAHGGDVTIEEWRDQSERVRRNPKSVVAMMFIQGENDTDEAAYQWKPNGQPGGVVDYNSHYTDPYAIADTYGDRSVAWNRAVRSSLGFPEMVCIYERVHYVGIVRTGIQNLCEYRQRHSQIRALENDPRYLVVDTSEIQRDDGVHFSSVGSARFSRAAVRLLKSSTRLSKLSYHARMIAMRAIDSGFELSDAGLAACETFVASPQYPKLSYLFVPTLTAPDPIDQERLKRCNLVVHQSGTYATGFLDYTPAHATAYCDLDADQQSLGAAIQTLLTAWGVSDSVEFPE